MANDAWGCLEPFEEFRRIDDTKHNFVPIDYTKAKMKEPTFTHASHGMIFAKDSRSLWELYKAKGAVLMQMRFDGLLGFPGGLVDAGESPIDGLNREMVEEIGLDLNKHKFTDANHVASYVNDNKHLILHFYVQEVTMEEFKILELNNLKAAEYGLETFGIVRPPLFVMGDGLRGLPAFLANQFAGNAREELILGLKQSGLLSIEELKTAIASCQTYLESSNSQLKTQPKM